MIEAKLKKFNLSKIDLIFDEIEWPENILSDIQSKPTDLSIVQYLVDQQYFDQAIQLLAFGLPVREAVWWGYVVAASTEQEKSCANTQHALRLIESWVRTPDAAQRIAAKNYADALMLSTPTSWIAMAVYWSGGSIAPAGQPDVEPAEFMAAYAVANGLLIAAEQSTEVVVAKKNIIQRGLHIAMGGNGCISL